MALAMDSGEVQVICSSTGDERVTLDGDQGRVFAVAFSEDGRSVAGTHTKGWWACEVPSGRDRLRVRKCRSDGAVLVEAAFSPSLAYVATVSSDCADKVAVCIAETGEVDRLLMLGNHSTQISAVGFSPDGIRIAAGGSCGGICLWDALTGATLQRWPDAHVGRVGSVSVHGNLVASGGRDNLIKVWHSGSGAALWTLAGHVAEVTSVSFAPHGKSIASGGLDRFASQKVFRKSFLNNKG